LSASKLQAAGYAGALAAALAAGVLLGWSPAGRAIDNQFYDFVSGERRDVPAQSVIVAVTERVFRDRGGLPKLREILADALNELAAARPAAVVLDVILADNVNPGMDAHLEAAMRATRNLILPTLLDTEGRWEPPIPRFRALAAAIGHAHHERDRTDGVSRKLSLEIVEAGERYWALALEALRAARGAPIEESPEDVRVGDIVIPAPRVAGVRLMPIRYRAPGVIPTISVLDIARNHDLIRGKVVFLGVTSLSAANDRLVSPAGQDVAGVEVHAQAFETMAAREFVTEPGNQTVFLTCAALAAAVGLLFWFLPGWRAYAPASLVLAAPFALPFPLFHQRNLAFPFLAPAAATWLSFGAAATYQHFVVRRRLRRTESEKQRYQQAIQWAAHEMRTPLTAIQGSSELMARYNLPEEKRGQLTEMINSESKRLARIIQTFLDVERMAEGHMELKREPFPAAELVDATLHRVAPLAERKRITVTLENQVQGTLLGDRELMEYALYNLLTNAIKYSPADTQVRVSSTIKDGTLRLAVADQGMGMDARELKHIFTKFYRTKGAEQSGEKGTGIGLSIVQQIVTHHGGRIEVASAPGKGSCFTMILSVEASSHAQTVDRRR
jgi:signal transduction histidine kinase